MSIDLGFGCSLETIESVKGKTFSLRNDFERVAQKLGGVRNE